MPVFVIFGLMKERSPLFDKAYQIFQNAQMCVLFDDVEEILEAGSIDEAMLTGDLRPLFVEKFHVCLETID